MQYTITEKAPGPKRPMTKPKSDLRLAIEALIPGQCLEITVVKKKLPTVARVVHCAGKSTGKKYTTRTTETGIDVFAL